MTQLSIRDHRRDSSGMTYVYPVVSRRAGGVSVGINLNPNNACNWRCIYCQVPGLTRGGPPPVDLNRLGHELRDLLNWIYVGDYLDRHVAPDARRVVDIAFSGNGEPTSAAEFPQAVAVVGGVLDAMDLPAPIRLRLITNGSLLDRAVVQRGIALLGERGGETWFKVDAVGIAAMRRVNSVGYAPETVLRRLRKCAGLCPTWVQTCLFALDGAAPGAAALDDYLRFLGAAADVLKGVHLYGVARPSCQPEAARIAALSADRMGEIGRRIERETGLPVRVSP
jgi:wyosine [tRNA(Phe)-imidazoG37] synthetase (radical SAM superfamily)